MMSENKKKFYEEIEKKTGVISTPTEVKEYTTMTSNGFPTQLFIEWKEDCIRKYNDIHWAKIWSDHLKAQAYDMLINSAVQKVEQPEEKKEQEIPMIGDGGIENGERNI